MEEAKFTEEQWEALKRWVEAIAHAAVANDRPQHHRMCKEATETSYEENMARSAFGLETNW